MYRPLPHGLTLQKSSIEGYGIFATEDFEEDTKIGLSHLVVDGDLIRTPLGGFINHSNTPNVIKEKVKDRYYLYTIKDIKKGEELTLTYTFYSMEE